MKILKPLVVHAAALPETVTAAVASPKVVDIVNQLMPEKKHERSSHFPRIEAKYGEPMKYWFTVMKDLADLTYDKQMKFLQEEHGFSRVHANALIMYSKGSTSSKRFDSVDAYIAKHDPVKQKTVKKILKTVKANFPKLELVIAWNQPMFKLGSAYIFGLSVLKNHILIAPFDPKVLKKVEKLLDGYVVNKKTVRVPVDWQVDEKLLIAMIRESIKAKKK